MQNLTEPGGFKGLPLAIPGGEPCNAKLFPYSFHSYGLSIFIDILKLRLESYENKNPPALPRE